jgi:hypothetical protein
MVLVQTPVVGIPTHRHRPSNCVAALAWGTATAAELIREAVKMNVRAKCLITVSSLSSLDSLQTSPYFANFAKFNFS